MTDSRGAFDAASKRYRHINTRSDDYPTVLRQIIEACDTAVTDGDFARIAVLLVDPFINQCRPVGWTAFAGAMRSSQSLRKAYTGAELHIPDDVVRRLDALVQINEWIDGADPERFGFPDP